MTASGGRPVLFKEVLEAVVLAEVVVVQVAALVEVVAKEEVIILNKEKDQQ